MTVKPINREELIQELKQLDNPCVCRTESEWDDVRARQAEICKLLDIEFPEDAWS